MPKYSHSMPQPLPGAVAPLSSKSPGSCPAFGSCSVKSDESCGGCSCSGGSGGGGSNGDGSCGGGAAWGASGG